MAYDKVTVEAFSIIGCLKQLDNDMPDDLRVLIKNNLARKIGSAIYDLPERFSGMVSTSLVDDYGYLSGKRCSEHFYSRQRCGHRIIRAYECGELTLEFCIDLLNKYRQVHWVTPQENTALSKIQNSKEHGSKSHAEQYALSGIEMIPNPGRAPYYFYNKYIINGSEFDNIDQVAKALGLEYNEILRRCNSTAKSNVDWRRIISKKVSV